MYSETYEGHLNKPEYVYHAGEIQEMYSGRRVDTWDIGHIIYYMG